MAADALGPTHIVNIAAAHPHAQDESFVRSSRPMLIEPKDRDLAERFAVTVDGTGDGI